MLWQKLAIGVGGIGEIDREIGEYGIHAILG